MKCLKDLEDSFSMVRSVFFTVIICNGVVLFFSIIYTSVFCVSQSHKIYALQGETPLMVALNQNVKENRLAEAKAQLDEFHRLFFAVNPDMGEIEYNARKAIEMSDNSVVAQYNSLKESNFYHQIVDAGIRCAYRNDSVMVDMSAYPYRVVSYGRMCIHRHTGDSFRRLVTSCSLRNVNRTDKIPHGFLIENFKILDNGDLQNTVSLYNNQ